MGRKKKELVIDELDFNPDHYEIKVSPTETALNRILNGEEEQLRAEIGDRQVDRLLMRYHLVQR